MDVILPYLQWFGDPANWHGSSGIPSRVLEHLWFSALAMLIALAVAAPLGLLIGHTNRGGAFVINLGNLGRAVPTLGILVLALIIVGFGLVPILVALAALGIPPILVNTYTGVRSVDPEVRDAATGMGMTGTQVLLGVELPLALPLIMAGLRTSAVQIVATATLAAYVTLGGLGRFIFDGLFRQELSTVVGGAVLVAVLALVVEWALGRLQQAVVSKSFVLANQQETAPAEPQPV